MITGNQLRQLVPALGSEAGPWALTLSPIMDRFGITTPARVAAFLAQVVHESAGFTRLVENLDYSAERLAQVCPRRFPALEATQPYARQPERLANYVYADRMGNGPPESGDGWRFRGRGLLQLTGRATYGQAGRALSLPLEVQPDLAAGRSVAALAAGWYWEAHGCGDRSLNQLADAGDLEGMTREINGGLVGLQERRQGWRRALAALGGHHSMTRESWNAAGYGVRVSVVVSMLVTAVLLTISATYGLDRLIERRIDQRLGR